MTTVEAHAGKAQVKTQCWMHSICLTPPLSACAGGSSSYNVRRGMDH